MAPGSQATSPGTVDPLPGVVPGETRVRFQVMDGEAQTGRVCRLRIGPGQVPQVVVETPAGSLVYLDAGGFTVLAE